jgi:hypothetical protein
MRLTYWKVLFDVSNWLKREIAALKSLHLLAANGTASAMGLYEHS